MSLSYFIGLVLFVAIGWYITVPYYKKDHKGISFWQELVDSIKSRFSK